jgi:hypothetical protein
VCMCVCILHIYVALSAHGCEVPGASNVIECSEDVRIECSEDVRIECSKDMRKRVYSGKTKLDWKEEEEIDKKRVGKIQWEKKA